MGTKDSKLTLKLAVPVGNLTLAIRTIQIDSSQTIKALKIDIQDMNGIPYEQQLLLYSKNILDDSKTIKSYDIQNEQKIQLSKRPLFSWISADESSSSAAREIASNISPKWPTSHTTPPSEGFSVQNQAVVDFERFPRSGKPNAGFEPD